MSEQFVYMICIDYDETITAIANFIHNCFSSRFTFLNSNQELMSSHVNCFCIQHGSIELFCGSA
jgi:hypothetical protein